MTIFKNLLEEKYANFFEDVKETLRQKMDDRVVEALTKNKGFPVRPKKAEKVSVEFDSESQMHCVIGDTSGHAYGTHASPEAAEKHAKQHNSTLNEVNTFSPEPDVQQDYIQVDDFVAHQQAMNDVITDKELEDYEGELDENDWDEVEEELELAEEGWKPIAGKGQELGGPEHHVMHVDDMKKHGIEVTDHGYGSVKAFKHSGGAVVHVYQADKLNDTHRVVSVRRASPKARNLHVNSLAKHLKAIHHSKWLKEELEPVQELSARTLSSYVHVAHGDMKARLVGGRRPYAREEDDTHLNRMAGMKLARRRLRKNQVTKEELEPIEELSKKTLGSYIKKSKEEIQFHAMDMGRMQGQGAYDKVMKSTSNQLRRRRSKGISRAVDRLTKEELEPIHHWHEPKKSIKEDLDALIEAKAKKPTERMMGHYGKYVDPRKEKRGENKAGMGHPVELAYYAGESEAEKKNPSKNPYPKGRRHDEFERGKKLADPMGRWHGRNESVETDSEQLNELSAMLKRRYRERAGDDYNQAKVERDIKRQEKRRKGIQSSMKEDLEAIQELSKKTLGSYVKQSAGEIHTHTVRAERADTDDDMKKASRHYRKAGNRIEGIQKAAKKMSESVNPEHFGWKSGNAPSVYTHEKLPGHKLVIRSTGGAAHYGSKSSMPLFVSGSDVDLQMHLAHIKHRLNEGFELNEISLDKLKDYSAKAKASDTAMGYGHDWRGKTDKENNKAERRGRFISKADDKVERNTVIEKPKVHDVQHLSDGELYDHTQTSEKINDGDVFKMKSGRVGIMYSAWPTMYHGDSKTLHSMKTGKDGWHNIPRYKNSVELAKKHIKE